MSWVSDLVSASGLPVGGATLAVAMYGACAAAEKSARPEALKDIAHILTGRSWSKSVRPSALVERIFKLTFGDRHLSLSCFWRSAAASVLIVTILTLYEITVQNVIKTETIENLIFDVALAIFLFSVVPDYIALWKTRLLIAMSSSRQNVIRTCLVDILLSICIATVTITLITLAVNWITPVGTYYDAFKFVLTDLDGFFSRKPHVFSASAPIVLSTLFTSVWMMLILLSTIIVKLLAPVQQFTGWFFDVENHPIKAIGIVAGALAFIGSLIWSLVWAII